MANLIEERKELQNERGGLVREGGKRFYAGGGKFVSKIFFLPATISPIGRGGEFEGSKQKTNPAPED